MPPSHTVLLPVASFVHNFVPRAIYTLSFHLHKHFSSYDDCALQLGDNEWQKKAIFGHWQLFLTSIAFFALPANSGSELVQNLADSVSENEEKAHKY